jgi:short-subunit dehydrogenase
MTDTWIILGASSAMGRAFAKRVAAEGCDIVLAARDKDDLSRSAKDCAIRSGHAAQAVVFDVTKPDTFAKVLDAAQRSDGMINAAVFVGSMPAQDDLDADPVLVDGLIRDTLTGPAQFLLALAPLMEQRGGGTVIGVGSVAGDRGRIGNYTYGAAKAGLHTFLSGLRNRLTRFGGHVVTVKPGFVDTAMTWGLPGLFLVATPEDVADDLWTAVQKRRNTIYTPWFWRYIMLIIRSIPERIFKKMSI